MSRIGKNPVPVPDGVNASVDGQTVRLKGPRGELSWDVPEEIAVSLDDGELRVQRPSDEARMKALHGLSRSLLSNMVEGVTDGFRKALEIHGVGYRAQLRGKTLNLQLGFSHDVNYEPPEGITVSVPSPTEIIVEGADKQLVGQVAAEIRQVRPPEPYKGKGVRYKDEHVRRKAGKTATATGMA